MNSWRNPEGGEQFRLQLQFSKKRNVSIDEFKRFVAFAVNNSIGFSMTEMHNHDAIPEDRRQDVLPEQFEYIDDGGFTAKQIEKMMNDTYKNLVYKNDIPYAIDLLKVSTVKSDVAKSIEFSNRDFNDEAKQIFTRLANLTLKKPFPKNATKFHFTRFKYELLHTEELFSHFKSVEGTVNSIGNTDYKSRSNLTHITPKARDGVLEPNKANKHVINLSKLPIRIIQSYSFDGNITFTGTILPLTRFYDCVFNKCRFVDMEFQSDLVFSNCTFNKCEFRNCDFLNSDIEDVRFYDCAFAGTKWGTDKSRRNVAFTDCTGDHAPNSAKYDVSTKIKGTLFADDTMQKKTHLAANGIIILYTVNQVEHEHFLDMENLGLLVNRLRDNDAAYVAEDLDMPIGANVRILGIPSDGIFSKYLLYDIYDTHKFYRANDPKIYRLRLNDAVVMHHYDLVKLDKSMMTGMTKGFPTKTRRNARSRRSMSLSRKRYSLSPQLVPKGRSY